MIKKIPPFILIILASFLYILGLVFSFPYLLENLATSEKLNVIRNFFEYLLMFLSFLLFCSILLKNKWTKPFVYLLVLFLTINFMISISCYYVYHSGFNIGMAVSIFDTNTDEIMNMKNMFIFPIICSIIFFIFILLTASKISIKNKKRKYFYYFLASIWLLLPIIFKLKHNFVSNKGGGIMWKNVYYHLTDFQNAYNLREDFASINKVKPKFIISKEDEGVENIILVMGESVKRDHLSLYGYQKNTTPNLIKESNNMVIYNNAVSPAGITNISVPLILSNINPEDFKTNYQKLAYNIINFANQTDYKTYWLSTQSVARSITTIASNAKNKKWINGFDEKLLPEFNSVMSQPGKKLIILHINGSHPDPCNKFPESERDPKLDCYDNSIKYTDKILGELFAKLSSKNAILIYTADHALKINNSKYLHTDSKESSQVPYLIWHSSKVNNQYKETKKIDSLTQNTIIFPTIIKYMGIKPPQNYKNKQMKYLKIDMTPIDYKQLEN